MANDQKQTKDSKGPGRTKEFGEFNAQGVRTRNVKVWVRLDIKDKRNRKTNPDNFVEVEYTEPNYKTVDAAKAAIGNNLLAVLNDGIAAQERKNAVSLVSTARNISKQTGETIQEAMEMLRQRKAQRSAKK